jgi:hypothetical protein
LTPSYFQHHATAIIEELFPSDSDVLTSSTSASFESPLLDRLVVAMSTDLIDDFPVSDPRWLQTVPGKKTSFNQFRVLNQFQA